MGAPSRLHRLILLLVFFSGGTAFAGSQEPSQFPAPYLDNWSGVPQHYDGAKRVFEGDPEELLEIEVTFNGKPQTKAQIIPKDQSKRYLGKTDEGNAFPRGPPSALDTADAAGKGALKADGTFIDAALEANYGKYLTRKAAEGKAPRPRLEWKQVRDYWLNDSPMARGNRFNEKAKEWYDVFELNLAADASGKTARLDSYIHGSEIISRKASDLGDIDLSTFESYLKEIHAKYYQGRVIRSNAFPELDGKVLTGKYVLELPDSNLSLSNLQDFIDIAKNKYNVELRFRPE